MKIQDWRTHLMHLSHDVECFKLIAFFQVRLNKSGETATLAVLSQALQLRD